MISARIQGIFRANLACRKIYISYYKRHLKEDTFAAKPMCLSCDSSIFRFCLINFRWCYQSSIGILIFALSGLYVLLFAAVRSANMLRIIRSVITDKALARLGFCCQSVRGSFFFNLAPWIQAIVRMIDRRRAICRRLELKSAIALGVQVIHGKFWRLAPRDTARAIKWRYTSRLFLVIDSLRSGPRNRCISNVSFFIRHFCKFCV